MMAPNAIGQVVNIGSDRPISIRQLAQLVVDNTNSKSHLIFQSYTDAYDRDFEDVRRRVPNVSKLQSLIDFRPQYSLEDIITELAAIQRTDL
jgi:UDP-glucose 4-epimerase